MLRASSKRLGLLIVVVAFILAYFLTMGQQTSCISSFQSAQFTKLDTMASFPDSVQALVKAKTHDVLDHVRCDLSGIADPGEAYNATDVIKCGTPCRRLVFGGISQDVLFICYEHGGIGKHYHLLVFANAPSGWVLCFVGRFSPFAGGKHGKSVSLDLAFLRELMRSGAITDRRADADTIDLF